MTRKFVLLVAASLSSLLVASASAQTADGFKITCPELTPPAKRTPSAQVSILAVDTPAGCNTKDNSNSDRNDCDLIPVIVKELANGTCTAELPYSSLRVSHKRKSNSKVTWVIWGPPNYTFHGTEGVKLVRGIPKPGVPVADDPDKHWDKLLTETTGRTFTIKTKSNEKGENGEVCHYVRVLSPKGIDCTTIDPVIANEPN